jgi:hypothetical protein
LDLASREARPNVSLPLLEGPHSRMLDTLFYLGWVAVIAGSLHAWRRYR